VSDVESTAPAMPASTVDRVNPVRAAECPDIDRVGLDPSQAM
jgi:hypothetical protein